MRLQDGRTAFLRPIVPDDAAALAEAIRDADAETLRRRFLGAPPPLTGELLRHLTTVDYARRLALAGFDPATGRGIAIARYEPVDERTAEVAIAVDPAWRRVGLATAMIELLAEAALKHGYDAFTATYLADNRPVAALVTGSDGSGHQQIRQGLAEVAISLDRTAFEDVKGVPMTRTPDEALAQLVRDGVISAAQAMAVREALQQIAPPARVRWAEVAGYVGGGLLLAGALSLAATSWADLSRIAHVVILLAATAALLAAGIALLGTRPRERAPTARSRSGSVSLALAPATAALAAAELAADHTTVLAGAAGLLVAALGYALARTAPPTLACAFFAALTTGSLADELTGGSVLAVGLSLVVLGVAWTALVLTGVIGQRGLGLGLGAVIALFGGQQGLGYDPTMVWAYVMTAAVAVACLLLYRRERAWVLLVAGVGGFTLAVPEAIWHWTGGAVGGSLIVMVAGGVLVTASVLGIRWHRTSRPEHAGSKEDTTRRGHDQGTSARPG
ncbi:GNAT family N-acetyltransferase [Nonomuraea maheshkhaliensis]|uniref:GNAT family N-acetyltransferase n=1 Tax=Nonomuraea maheshkhaliensis TaxID=419590 RepID=UPI0031F7F6FD